MSRKFVVTVLVAAIAVVALLAVALTRDGGRRGDDASSGRASGGQGTTGTAADSFLSRYVDSDGRVVRHDQGGDTVSEGQAYALLLTAATGDRERFATVWNWTREHLQRDDGLFAWRWAEDEVADDSPAADADVDIASALATAGDRFGDPALVDEARRIATAVLEHETAKAGGRLVLVAGPWARDRRIVNPSYLATCGGADLATVTGDARWQRIAADGVALVQNLAADGLPPDWAVLDDDGRLQAVASPDELSGPGKYGLDAARIPARLPACPGGREIAAGLWARIGSLEGEGAALAYSLDGRRLHQDSHPLGLIGAAGAARAAGDTATADRLFAFASELDREHSTYYGAAWLALGEAVFGIDGDPEPNAAVPARRQALPVMWARAPSQPDPTTTAPPATEPPTTAPPATTPEPPPTTTTPTDLTDTTGPTSPTTAPGSSPTTTRPGGAQTTTTTGANPGTPTTTSGTAGPSGSEGDTGSVGSGDLSAPGIPDEELRTGTEVRSDPDEPARRRTGAIALSGFAATTALGAVLGLRERAVRLNRRSVEPGRPL